eukprot:gene18761-2338_t
MVVWLLRMVRVKRLEPRVSATVIVLVGLQQIVADISNLGTEKALVEASVRELAVALAEYGSCLPAECAAAPDSDGGGGGGAAAEDRPRPPDRPPPIRADGTAAVAATKTAESPRSSHGSCGSPPSRRQYDARSAASPHPIMSPTKPAPPRQGPRDALQRRGASLATANVRGYLSVARRAGVGALGAFHRQLLGQFTHLTAACRGLTDGVDGDRFHASQTPGAVPLPAAMTDTMGSLPPPRLPTGTLSARSPGAAQQQPEEGVSAGVASGELVCGVIGTESWKSFALIGAAASWRAATARAARAVANGATALGGTRFLFDADPWRHYNSARRALPFVPRCSLHDVVVSHTCAPPTAAVWRPSDAAADGKAVVSDVSPDGGGAAPMGAEPTTVSTVSAADAAEPARDWATSPCPE